MHVQLSPALHFRLQCGCFAAHACISWGNRLARAACGAAVGWFSFCFRFALAALHATLLAIFCATAHSTLTQFPRDLQQQLCNYAISQIANETRILLTLHFTKIRLLFIGSPVIEKCHTEIFTSKRVGSE